MFVFPFSLRRFGNVIPVPLLRHLYLFGFWVNLYARVHIIIAVSERACQLRVPH